MPTIPANLLQLMFLCITIYTGTLLLLQLALTFLSPRHIYYAQILSYLIITFYLLTTGRLI